MEMERIHSYCDPRFSQRALNQHGCFLVAGQPCEVEIVSATDAVVRHCPVAVRGELIALFREYAPQITTFYDEAGELIQKLESVECFEVPLEAIQPAQFYVDADKVAAVQTFVQAPEDVVVQVVERDGRILCADGHTRLYCAALLGFERVRAVRTEAGDYLADFAAEAARRGIRSARDLTLLDHGEYEEKWIGYCEAYFAGKTPAAPEQGENEL